MTNSIPGFSDAIDSVESTASGMASDILTAVSVILFAFIGLSMAYMIWRLLRKGLSGPTFNA